MTAPPQRLSSPPPPPSGGPPLPTRSLPSLTQPFPHRSSIRTRRLCRRWTPFKATGKPHTLWVAFAKFYEDNGQLDDECGCQCECGCRDGRLTSPLPHPSWWAGSQPGL